MSSSTGYGPKLDPIALQKVLDHVMARNAQIAKAGHLGTPLCVWGSHGLGKTQMVQEYARSKGWKPSTTTIPPFSDNYNSPVGMRCLA